MRLQDLVGLDVLVGLTYLDAEGQVLRQEQFHGPIEEADRSTTWVRPSDGGERRWVPTDPAAFRPAPGGTYRHRHPCQKRSRTSSPGTSSTRSRG
jgi:hypothetical protein